jgi:hypothetical protein
MPPHRDTACLSFAGGRRRRWRPFRTADLNAAGWTAVGGLCAAAGLAASRHRNVSAWILVPAGALATFAAVVAADRRRWSHMRTSYSWTDDPDEVRRTAARLERAGIDASAGTDGPGRPTLRYLNRDHRRVTRAFRNAGLPPPRMG